MNNIYQKNEELKARINFRVVDCPCCGKCKWFEREYEDTKCHHPLTQDVTFYSDFEADCDYTLCPDQHNVCDLFETGKYTYGEEDKYWTKKAREQEDGQQD